ncbi:MAG: exodeoxyribonuclease VII large subunit [Pseudomonadota bacterium]
MDLLDDDDAPSNTPEFSVSDLTGAIKRTLEGAFGRVRVRGELGRVMRARSGHVYYDLKDDKNVISCTTWKGQVASLGMDPEEGLEVIVTGRLGTYGPQSRYSINVDTMEMAGEGALMAMLERRRKALAAEGLFDQARKRPLPYLPEVIGVVTSPSGAVIRDILHRLRDRFPRRVLIWPVAVQGKSSAAEVARAIRGFNGLAPGGPIPRPDLLIVARGGGSLEDLWGFNEEIVVRAAAESTIPLISAVGHETDTTLIDHAADQRAPTPTAAAEMAVPVRRDLIAWVEGQGAQLARGITAALTTRDQRLRDLSRGLPRPDGLFDTARERLDRWGEALAPALIRRIGLGRDALQSHAAELAPLVDGQIAAARVAQGRLVGRLSPARISDRAMALRHGVARAVDALRRDAATRVPARRQSLDAVARLLQSLSYKDTLRRGYAVVRDAAGIVTEAKAARSANTLEIEFADGKVTVGATGPAPKRGKPKPGASQADLFGS